IHIGTRLGTPWMEGEGTSHATNKFESGAIGYHAGTWGARGTRLGYSFHAHCSEGMLELKLTEGKLWYHGKGQAHEPDKAAPQTSTVLLEIPNAKPTDEEMLHFIHCIRTGEKP